jgi:hypothetical protein
MARKFLIALLEHRRASLGRRAVCDYQEGDVEFPAS